MRRLYIVPILVLLLVGFGATAFADDGCADALGCVEIAPGEAIEFGGMLNLSGPTTRVDIVEAIQLAMLARDGALLGRDIAFVWEDSACSEEIARDVAQQMAARPSIVGIIGTNCSLAAKGALPVISEAGLLMISPANTSPFLTNSDREAGGLYQPGYFRTAHNDLFQGELSARFAFSLLDVATVATIDDGDPYTKGLAGAMAATFTSLGGEVVFQGEVSKGATDVSEIISAIAESGAELVFFPLFEDEMRLVIEAVANRPGLEDSFMLTAESGYSSEFSQTAGAAAIGLYVAASHVSGAAYEAFLETWRQEIDEAGPSGSSHAHAFDAANLLFEAVEAVAEEREDGALVIGRGALRDALSATENYAGLTGSLTCQDESPYAGDCATGEALAIFQLTAAEIQDGNWPPPVVWTAAMAKEE